MKSVVVIGIVVLFVIDLGNADDTLSQDAVRKRKVDILFSKWDSNVSPGCVVAVVKDGKVIFKRAYGMADLNHDVPLQAKSVFHVASNSKQFTAAAIVLLAQQGRLSLDDPVHQHIPELPDFGHVVTIRNLVHHTSGLPDQWTLLELAGWRGSQDLITNQDVMRVLARQKELSFVPGENMIYSNTNYTLLGMIVENVSGQSLRKFTTETLFEPLGMRDTFFRDDFRQVVKNEAVGYERESNDKAFKISVTNFETVGATNLLTTVEDLVRWDHNFYSPAVGGDAFIHQLHERGRLSSGKYVNYAFGLWIGEYKGLKTVRHGGADAGYRSDLLRFPDQRFSVICLCNAAEMIAWDLCDRVADIYLEDEFTSDTTFAIDDFKLPQEELSRYEGRYFCEEQNIVTSVTAADGKLSVRVGEWKTHWRPVGQELFVQESDPLTTVRFDTQDDGVRNKLTIDWAWSEPPHTYQRYEPYQPNPRELESLVGTYRSEALDSTWRIVVDDDNLFVHRLKSAPAPLVPVFEDTYYSNVGYGCLLRFARNDKKTVSGFKLSNESVHNIQFWKTQN